MADDFRIGGIVTQCKNEQTAPAHLKIPSCAYGAALSGLWTRTHRTTFCRSTPPPCTTFCACRSFCVRVGHSCRRGDERGFLMAIGVRRPFLLCYLQPFHAALGVLRTLVME